MEAPEGTSSELHWSFSCLFSPPYFSLLGLSIGIGHVVVNKTWAASSFVLVTHFRNWQESLFARVTEFANISGSDIHFASVSALPSHLNLINEKQHDRLEAAL